ncbi:MAG: UvrD-helicase domain-containing protein [Clostridia bacterium]|nr:UvrD-helicase domain-containing protein [Clostridia bacterium]
MLEIIVGASIFACVVLFLLLAVLFCLIKTIAAKLFLCEFSCLKEKNEFIDKKTISKILKKYAFAYKLLNIFHNEDIDKFVSIYENFEQITKKYNDQFVNEEKIKYSNLFLNIDNKSLDNQQQNVCVRNQNATLVVAGAGTGKTLTICGKVKYLLEKGIDSNEILLISFTNKACDELSQRLTKITNVNIKAQTFHKFALGVIGEKLKIADENYVNRIIEKCFKELICCDFEFKYMFLEEFAIDYTKFLNEQSKQNDSKEFIEDDEKIKFIKDIENIDIGDVLTTYNKEKVKSPYERTIANVLYLLGVKYEYESFYQTNLKIDEKYEWLRTYRPDFYLPEYNVYIEHFANPNWFENAEDRIKYKKQMRNKIKAHKKFKTKLICSYSGYGDNLIKNLLKNLIKYNINVNVDIQDILNNIAKLKELDFIDNKLKNFQTFIKLFKNNNYSFKKFQELNRTNFIKMVEKVYLLYQNHLAENNMLDFEDIINKANQKLIHHKKNQKHYKYVIVDEYQDASKNKVDLLNNLIKLCDCKLLCVGDDWQSIYRFAGSDTNLFTSFGHYIEFSELLKIETTYRNSQELINASSNFIQKNKSQIKKQLKSKKSISKPILIDFVNYFDFKTIVNLAEKDKKDIKNCSKLSLIKDDIRIQKFIKFLDFSIKKNYKEILVLGRNNFDIEIFEALPFAMPELFKKDNSNYEANELNYKGLKILCLTIHKSKGLEADAVVLWNLREGVRGLPDTKGDEEELKQVLTQPDEMSYAEDRRLFYVALTRTKNEVLIIALEGHLSSFVDELMKDQNQYIGTNKAFCQKCGAEMILFKDYNFFGCSNYRLTGCDYKIQNAKEFLYTQHMPTPVYKQKYYYNKEINSHITSRKEIVIEDETLIRNSKTDENEDIISKDIEQKDDVFICGWLSNNLKNKTMTKEERERKREKNRQLQEKLIKLRKKVYINKFIEITHPDIDGVWKIKILPVTYVANSNQNMSRVRFCEANIKENTIAEDTPLAQSLLNKFEGEEYSYSIEGETITGKIVKVYHRYGQD